MTFSLAARDPGTGCFGMVISSSSPAVAARCVNLRAGVGAVASQNISNPALGPLGLDLLSEGCTPDEVVSRLYEADRHIEYRQLMVLGTEGSSAVFEGMHTLGTHGFAQASGVVAAGNLLAQPDVPRAMLDGYRESRGTEFEERLLHGFAAAVKAGGEAGRVRSAGLAVVDFRSWRLTDLRVDDADDPLEELRRLVDLWLPQRDDYSLRATEPNEAPAYGVPGDE